MLHIVYDMMASLQIKGSHKDNILKLFDDGIADGHELITMSLNEPFRDAFETMGYRGGLIVKRYEGLRYISEKALEVGAEICIAAEYEGYQKTIKLVAFKRT